MNLKDKYTEHEIEDIKKEASEVAEYGRLVDFMLTERDFDFARPFLKSVQIQYRKTGDLTRPQINGIRRTYEAGSR